MTKEEYLNELNKAFGDFKFFESDHHYEYKGKRKTCAGYHWRYYEE